MAEKKYLNLEGLQDVANHVNTRLKTVTTIPASADDGAVRLYVGETGVTYKKGHIYQYNATDLEWIDITSSSEYTAGNGIDITDNEISVETYIFTGTQAQWDALTTDQKKEYDICNITDDASSDDEIYTKSEIDVLLDDKANVTAITNPNLLDNPWFTVNQRGFTTGTEATKMYTVDRWFINNSKATFSNGIIEVELGSGGGNIRPRFSQFTEHSIKTGQKYTLTVIAKVNVESGNDAPNLVLTKSDGSYYGSKYGYLQLHETGNNYETFSYSFAPTEDVDNCGVAIISSVTTSVKQSTVSIKTIKLELGSVSTLAMDTAPNYQQELAKCQRYFQKFTGDFNSAYAYTTNYLFFIIQLNVPMRATPTVGGTLNVKNTNGASTVTGFTFSTGYSNFNNCKLGMTATKTAHGLTNTDAFLSVDNNDPLTLSADL